jgi:glycosyltransferase involved in cell wall biosynthesis
MTERTRKILYVNQTAQMSGAERSLLELLDGVGPRVAATVACPEGELSEEVRSRGLPVCPIAGTDVSFRLHPVHTSRGLAWIAVTGWGMRGLARGLGVEFVHANTTRAGLAAVFGARAGGRPAIVHVRDWTPPGRLPAATLGAIEIGAAAIVANSRYTADQFSGRAGSIRVIHDPVETAALDPDRIDRDPARREFGLEADDLVMAVVAQLTPWKGQDDAIRVLANLKPDYPHLRLLIAGSPKFAASATRFDNLAYQRDLRRLAQELGVESEARFLGERSDVPRVLRAADLLLVPSWQEAFGRIAVEGMAMRLPVLATRVGGPAEIVRDRVDGRLLEPRDPKSWASAARILLEKRSLRREMGERGRQRAVTEFSVKRHVEQVISLYDELLAEH